MVGWWLQLSGDSCPQEASAPVVQSTTAYPQDLTQPTNQPMPYVELAIHFEINV